MYFSFLLFLLIRTIWSSLSLPNDDTKTVYASPNGSDLDTCGTQEYPCRSFQQAFDHASESSVTVMVSSGSYVQRSVVNVGSKTVQFIRNGDDYPSYSTLNLKKDEAVFNVASGSLTVKDFQTTFIDQASVSILKLQSDDEYGSASFSNLSVVAGKNSKLQFYASLFIVDGGKLELTDFSLSYVSFLYSNIIQIPEKKQNNIVLKLTRCNLHSIYSRDYSVLIHHVADSKDENNYNNNYQTRNNDGDPEPEPEPDPLPSVTLTIDGCSFTEISAGVSGALISLTLNSSSVPSSLSLTDSIIANCDGSYSAYATVYLFATKSACDFQFTNVSFSNNSCYVVNDVYIRADKLLAVVSASKFALNFSSYNPSRSLYGVDNSDYTTNTDLISLFTQTADDIYIGGSSAADSFTCGTGAEAPHTPCATMAMALHRLSEQTHTLRTLHICTTQKMQPQPVAFTEPLRLERMDIVGHTHAESYTEWGYAELSSAYNSYTALFTVVEESTFENIYFIINTNDNLKHPKQIFSISDANLTLSNVNISYSNTLNGSLIEMVISSLNATNLTVSSMHTSYSLINLASVQSASFINCSFTSIVDSYEGNYLFMYSNSSTISMKNSSFLSSPNCTGLDFYIIKSSVSISQSSFSRRESAEPIPIDKSIAQLCGFTSYTLLFRQCKTVIADSNFTHFPNGALGIEEGSLVMSNSYFSHNIQPEYLKDYPDMSHNLYCDQNAEINVTSLYNSTNCTSSKPLFFDVQWCNYSASCFANHTSTLFVPNITAIKVNGTKSSHEVSGTGTNLFPCNLYGSLFSNTTEESSVENIELRYMLTQNTFNVSFSKSYWKQNKKHPLYLRLRYGTGSANEPYHFTDTPFKISYITTKEEIRSQISSTLAIALPCSVPFVIMLLSLYITFIKPHGACWPCRCICFCEKGCCSREGWVFRCCPQHPCCTCCCCCKNSSGRNEYLQSQSQSERILSHTAEEEGNTQIPEGDVPPYIATSITDTDTHSASKEESLSHSLTMPSTTVAANYPSEMQNNSTEETPSAYSEPVVPSAPYSTALPYALPAKQE